MNRTTSFVAPFLLGVGLTIALTVLSGAANPEEHKNTLDTQVLPIAGGLVLMLAINDHDKDRLYLYKFPTEKDGKVKLSGSIDLSAVGKKELPGKIDMD